MRVDAAVLDDYGVLGMERLDLTGPAPGEVLVRMCAAGVCHSDYHVYTGDLPLPTPMVLGHEGAGVVEAVGPGVATVSPGDAVVLSWLPACGRCRACLAGTPELCAEAARLAAAGTLYGGRTPFRRPGGPPVHQFSLTGAFADHTVVPEAGVVPLPAGTDLEIAALFGCSVLTGTGAVWRTAAVAPGESVAVFGAGGVGCNVLRAAAMVSAHPRIAIDANGRRLDAASAFGATHQVRAEGAVDAVLALTGGAGVDVAFEAVGRPETIAQAFNVTAAGGRTVVIGVSPPHLDVSLNAFAIPSQERRVLGCWYGSSHPRRDVPALLRLHAAGLLPMDHMVSRRYRLEQLDQAFADMLAGRGGRGLIVFGPSGGREGEGPR